MRERLRKMRDTLFNPGCSHDVPSNAAISFQGAVFQGGFCTKCKKLIQGELLGSYLGLEELDPKSGEWKTVSTASTSLAKLRAAGWQIAVL